LRFDVGEENRLFAVSSRVVEAFAEHYIKEELGLGKKMWLVRASGGRGFPTYQNETWIRQHHAVLAYQR